MATAKKKPQPTSKNEAAAKTKPAPAENKDLKTGRFLPGHSGNGGRPKGARSQLAETFLRVLKSSFDNGGAEAVERVKKEDPATYIKIVANLLPRQITGEDGEPIKVEHTAGLSSLESALDAIRAKEEARAAAESDEG